MSATDPTQRRLDVLQALDLVPGESAAIVAERAGYNEQQTRRVLRGLAAEGLVTCATGTFGSAWRRKTSEVSK